MASACTSADPPPPAVAPAPPAAPERSTPAVAASEPAPREAEPNDIDAFAKATRSRIYPVVGMASASDAAALFAACRQLQDNDCAKAARARMNALDGGY